MKIKIILTLFSLALFVQCQKNRQVVSTRTKNVQIVAENNHDLGVNMKIKLFSDSSYTFTVLEESFNYEKEEKFKGFYFLENDTINFSPFDFKYANTDKAVIKNNFIEFIDSPLRIEIQKNLFNSKPRLDFSKYENYAVFTFSPKLYNPANYNYDPNSVKPYDLNQNDLEALDSILKKCFSENRVNLKAIDNYVIQCIPVINSKQEKEVWVRDYCRGSYISKEFKYFIIRMNDGGNCNINLKVNLTKRNCFDLNIAGEA
ncbi:hypothetical protein JAO76_00485 [Pontibacter sp. BT310]|uniref:Lipoprotein n=1 Tax=Pontibacter populi TaxID=890055 RepID=A0ABS6X684_9BACT|nr:MULTISPECIES: hypothetical protein [Pontibacter]MBJ6116651.1 hypothetical protein [Pontibacter sp. BT310]MBR0569075.1 hypothetical protein [Microvirga sp. STS03]MBW3363505.1 hypothetical protein [Pontibacter populi]